MCQDEQVHKQIVEDNSMSGRNEILQHFKAPNEPGFFSLLDVYGISHSVLPTQSSMPTALAPSKLFHESHPVQLALNATSATALGHIVPPTVIDPTPNQHLKDMYVFIESPHPNINSELANCRGWIAMENLRMKCVSVTAARFVALPHLGGSSSVPLCANLRRPKKKDPGLAPQYREARGALSG
ncbi:hypothetical protein B0H13DRAFT_2267633 [Mycena leptocephala]|nr:hypothetical protein B0H13DRAFT_2267633 [Mycena leptocephala]